MREFILRYWVQFLFASITTVFTFIIKKLWKKQKMDKENFEKEQTALKDGIMALLHSEIHKTYTECMSKGYASVAEIKNLEYVYKPYKMLGGNGTGDELFERVRKMPTAPLNESQEG